MLELHKTFKNSEGGFVMTLDKHSFLYTDFWGSAMYPSINAKCGFNLSIKSGIRVFNPKTDDNFESTDKTAVFFLPFCSSHIP